MSSPTFDIRVEGLAFRAVIGAHDWERDVLQALRVDAILRADVEDAARADRLAGTVDYSAVASNYERIAVEGRFHLLEALVLALAEFTLDEFERVQEVTVTARKPDAVPLTESVGVTVTLRRSDRA